MVDLPDGGVLGDQLPLTAAQFGDVPKEDQGADPDPLGLERDRPELDHPARALDLELTGRVAAGEFDQGLVNRAAGGGEFGGDPAQVLADQVGSEAEAVVRGETVGTGVLDDSVGVEPDQPVADARRCVHVDLLAGEREGPGGDHLGQVGGRLEVSELQSGRCTDGQEVGVAGDDSEDPALTAYGDRLDPYRHLLAPLRVALAHDPALVQRRVEQRAAAARHQVADHVVLVGGGAGVGPHLGHGHIAGAVAGGNPQHEVGEGQIGEQLPLRDQQMQPLQVGVTEGCVLADEVVHGGHVCERTRGWAMVPNRTTRPHV